MDPAPQKQCSLCSLKYGIYKREHRCKRCYRSICQECGQIRRLIIPQNGEPAKEKHKICPLCGYDSFNQQTLHEKYNLRWACDSQVGHKWLSNLYNPEDINKEKFETTLKKDQETKEGTKKSEAYQLFENYLSNCYQEYDEFYKTQYSYREMIYYLQKYDSRDKILKDIQLVLRAFVNRYHDTIGFCLEMVDVVIFLLCFNTPPYAYAILRQLYGAILNPNLYPSSIKYYFSNDTVFQESMLKQKIQADSVYIKKNQKTQQQDFKTKNQEVSVYLLDVMKSIYPIDVESQPAILKFFEIQALPMILSFMVKKVNFTSSFFIMNAILTAQKEKRPELLIKSILAVTYCNLETIQKFGIFNPQQVLWQISAATQVKFLRQNMKTTASIKGYQPRQLSNNNSDIQKNQQIELQAQQQQSLQQRIQQLQNENSKLSQLNSSLNQEIELLQKKQTEFAEKNNNLIKFCETQIQNPAQNEQDKTKNLNEFSQLKKQVERESVSVQNQLQQSQSLAKSQKQEQQQFQEPSFSLVESQYQLRQDPQNSQLGKIDASNVLELKLQEYQKQIQNLEVQLQMANNKLQQNGMSKISEITQIQGEAGSQSNQSSMISMGGVMKTHQEDKGIELSQKDFQIQQLKEENFQLKDKIIQIEQNSYSQDKELKDAKKNLDSLKRSSTSNSLQQSQSNDELKSHKETLEGLVIQYEEQAERLEKKAADLQNKLDQALKEKEEAQKTANDLNMEVEAKDQAICELEDQITKYQMLQEQINDEIQLYNQKVEEQGEQQGGDPMKSEFNPAKKSSIYQSIINIQKTSASKFSEIENNVDYNRINDQVKKENQEKLTGFEQNLQNMQNLLAQLQQDVDSDSDSELDENEERIKKTIHEQNEEEFEDLELDQEQQQQEQNQEQDQNKKEDEEEQQQQVE